VRVDADARESPSESRSAVILGSMPSPHQYGFAERRTEVAYGMGGAPRKSTGPGQLPRPPRR